MDISFFGFNAWIIHKIKKTFFTEFFESLYFWRCVRTFFDKKADGPPASEDNEMLLGKIGYFAQGFYPCGQEPDFLTGWRKKIQGHAGYPISG